MRKAHDLSGKCFGSLTAISRDSVSSSGDVLWKCACECGRIVSVRSTRLLKRATKSCGRKGCREFLRSDISGQKFGRLTVIRRNGFAEFKSQRIARYECLCKCGKTVYVLRSNLQSKNTQSCGCLSRERLLASNTTHGLWGTKVYRLWWSAKQRSKKRNLPFDLTLQDIIIPAVCPLLGITLVPGVKRMCQSSPTLDRVIPSKGYIKGNVWVISQKANRMKSDFTLAQIQNFAAILELKIRELESD